MGIHQVSGLKVSLGWLRTFFDGHIVVGQKCALGFFHRSDRCVVTRLVLSFLSHSVRPFSHSFEVTVNRQSADFPFRPLSFQTLRGSHSVTASGLEELEVRIHFKEEAGK
jgi:hypothetical protein